MIQDYDGAEVVDACGERIGIVERSYVDASEIVRFVEVMIGAFLPKHRLIPLDGAHISSGTLTVPYTKDMIVESPDASPTAIRLRGSCLSGCGPTTGRPGGVRMSRWPVRRGPRRGRHRDSSWPGGRTGRHN